MSDDPNSFLKDRQAKFLVLAEKHRQRLEAKVAGRLALIGQGPEAIVKHELQIARLTAWVRKAEKRAAALEGNLNVLERASAIVARMTARAKPSAPHDTPPKRGRGRPKKVKHLPGYEGRLEIGSTEVDDPYERGKTLVVAFNSRHDVLTHWRARNQIDEAAFRAGQRFQAIYHRAEIGGAGAIDYAKPKVDGGYPSDPLSEQVMAAKGELISIRAVLGHFDYALLSRVLGQGEGIESDNYVGRRTRDAITFLAGHWGTSGPDRGRIRAERSTIKSAHHVENPGGIVVTETEIAAQRARLKKVPA